MIAAYNDWEVGINPVTTGEAPWLPAVYRQAMHMIRRLVNAERAKASEARRESLRSQVRRG